MKLAINAIYRATEGEGIFIGTPQTFVRFQGCNIGCLNCDSKDTWEFTDEGLDLNEVLLEVRELGIKRVSITGGDPLHPKNLPSVIALAKALKKESYYINIEAAGTRIPHELFDIIDFISFDYKTPSTGVKGSAKLLNNLAQQYAGKFQIKSVVETREDFISCSQTYKELTDHHLPWFLTPSYNTFEEFPKERFMNVISWNEESGGAFRVVGQQHKWIHGASKKMV